MTLSPYLVGLATPYDDMNETFFQIERTWLIKLKCATLEGSKSCFIYPNVVSKPKKAWRCESVTKSTINTIIMVLFNLQ